MKTNSGLKALKGGNINDDSTTGPLISLEECRAILNQDGFEYTDEEILIIRDFMYQMAEMTIRHYHDHRINQSTVISINEINDDKTKSIPIRPCKHRRAS